MTESLINSLANLPNLRVISRNTVFSFKGTKQTPQELGKILNARTLLTGHLTQRGEALTVQAELVDIASNAQIWGRRFDLKMADLLQVPEQIARQITEKLQLQLNNQQKASIAKQYTDNTEAYREYLKGRFYSLQYPPKGHTKALEHLRRAIEIDPTYALAYAGLADAYTTASESLLPPSEALSKAKAAAQKALDLDDKLAEAWAAHGHARLHEWDKAAIDDLNKAIALSPNSLTTQLWLGEYYFIWDVEKSVQVLENAAALDPLSAIAPSFLSFDYYMLRQPQKAIASAKKALDLDPNYYTEHAYLARFYAFAGDFKAATDELNKIPPAATDVFTLSTKGFIFGLQGKRQEAEKVVAELQKLAANQYVPPFEIAFVYNSLGNRDQTFFWLNKAYEDRSETLGFIRSLPDFDALHTDPRYTYLLQRMGLPQ